VVLVVPPGVTPTAVERALTDDVVDGAAPPAPFGLFAAMAATGIDNVRQLGVLGASPAAIEAGHRAGVGAIVGISSGDPAVRRPLLDAQPDVIVEAGEIPGAGQGQVCE
jgi:phosphoglycolate phosphatase-like HAD superfamily hydrolase